MRGSQRRLNTLPKETQGRSFDVLLFEVAYDGTSEHSRLSIMCRLFVGIQYTIVVLKESEIAVVFSIIQIVWKEFQCTIVQKSTDYGLHKKLPTNPNRISLVCAALSNAMI